jgi:hypothetical protein
MDNNKTPGIYPAMVRVMKRIGPIAKDRVNKQQGFNFRGVEDFYDTFHDIMADEGIFCTMEIVSESAREHTTKAGTLMLQREIIYNVYFVHEDGSSVSTQVKAEAMDVGDKASPKCASIAHKYALATVFLVPYSKMDDPDEHSPVVQVPDEQQARPVVAQPKQQPAQVHQPQTARPIPPTPVTQQQRDKLFALYKEVLGSGKTDEEVEQELKRYVESELGHPPEKMMMVEWAKIMTKLQEAKKAKRG